MAYLQSDPYKLTAVADPRLPGYEVTTNYVPPPADLALLFGDFVHNLRSALDHLARDLVIQAGGTPDDGPGGTTFPVHKQEKTQLRIKTKNGTVSSNDLRLIESVQPYMIGKPAEHPLARLSGLDNIDKHRRINVVALAATANVTFRPVDQKDEPVTQDALRYTILPAAGSVQSIKVSEPLIEGPVAVQGMHLSHVVLKEPDIYADPINLIGACTELYEYVGPHTFGLWFH